MTTERQALTEDESASRSDVPGWTKDPDPGDSVEGRSWPGSAAAGAGVPAVAGEADAAPRPSARRNGSSKRETRKLDTRFFGPDFAQEERRPAVKAIAAAASGSSIGSRVPRPPATTDDDRGLSD
eukprot:GHVU01234308.1.p1 GENE.GHVU01234308.1~~GHVU01234308.1.p1  ORF type:complete len:125 (+),score=15.83 GHVU01234308.1:516-890(+)